MPLHHPKHGLVGANTLSKMSQLLQAAAAAAAERAMTAAAAENEIAI
jgi:hypothetical protein